MKISGIQKNSLLDYPGKIATVIFTQGCNFKCGYCHNPSLNDISLKPEFFEEEILKYLAKSKKITDAVVITGGEPTLQSDLIKFIKKIKNLGYLVKLDTNGSNPEMLKKILKNKLVDYVAMDIKGPIEKYKLIVGVNCNLKNIKKSIKLIINCGINYEFRSTILPFWHKKNDIKNMAELIKGSQKYFLQRFETRDELVSPAFKTAKTYTKKEMKKFEKIAKKIIEHCEFRG
jgi:pyruvate formate lyase activating enzyme